MTEPGGPAWRQSIYYPYYFASRYGRGRALALALTCPGYDSVHDDNVPWLDIAGVHNEQAGTLTFFAVNRHATETLETEIALHSFGAGRVTQHQVMTHANLRACNTLAEPNAVVPRPGSGAKLADGTLALALPPHSWQMVRVTLG
jgi:alpha-N-arabinofuranosidase